MGWGGFQRRTKSQVRYKLMSMPKLSTSFPLSNQLLSLSTHCINKMASGLLDLLLQPRPLCMQGFSSPLKFQFKCLPLRPCSWPPWLTLDTTPPPNYSHMVELSLYHRLSLSCRTTGCFTIPFLACEYQLAPSLHQQHAWLPQNPSNALQSKASKCPLYEHLEIL